MQRNAKTTKPEVSPAVPSLVVASAVRVVVGETSNMTIHGGRIVTLHTRWTPTRKRAKVGARKADVAAPTLPSVVGT